ncbi:MAG: halocyanin domain-containing protein [Halovenus sp.]
MNSFDPDRRKALIAGGTAVAIALAGCSGDDDNGSDDGSGDDGSDDPQPGSGDGSSGGVPGEVSDHLGDVGNFDGTLADFTGDDTVGVTSGDVEGVEQQFAFGPPAIRVSQGTEVTWTWSGSDSHSVTHDNGDAFDSGIESGDGTTFSYTFDESGTYLYICIPHESLGQKGAVIVE